MSKNTNCTNCSRKKNCTNCPRTQTAQIVQEKKNCTNCSKTQTKQIVQKHKLYKLSKNTNCIQIAHVHKLYLVSMYINLINYLCLKIVRSLRMCTQSVQKVTAKKVLGNKVSEKKVLIFRTKKVMWEKSHFIKKSPEIKFYQFESLFSRTFFWLQYDFIQKRLSKKSLIIIKMHGNKGCLQPCKKRGNWY